MNYSPGVTDQRGQFVMQGNEMGQRQAQLIAQLLGYAQERSDRKQAAIGALQAVQGYGAGTGAGTADVAAGYNPANGGNDPGNELNGALDQAEAQGKKADAIRNVVTAYSPDPQVKTSLKAMSLGQLEGMLKGYSLKAAMAEQSAKMQDYAAQAQLRQQMAADDVSIGKFLQNYANAPGGPTDRFNSAMAQSPVTGRAVPRLIDALTKYGQATEDNSPQVMRDNPYPGVSIVVPKSGRGAMHIVQDPKTDAEAEKLSPTYTEDPVTGARALLYGKTAQSTGFNPAKASPQLLPMHDDEGKLVGWSQLDARGRATFFPNRTSGVLKTAVDEAGNPIEGYYVDGQGKLHDTRSALEKSLGTTAPAAKQSDGAAAYKSQADVVAAFKAGKLTRAAAAKLLNEKFGVPLK